MNKIEIALMQLMEMLEGNGQLHWWQKKAIMEILNAPPEPSFDLNGCRVCGAKGVMGYVCPRADCPSMARATP